MKMLPGYDIFPDFDTTFDGEVWINTMQYGIVMEGEATTAGGATSAGAGGDSLAAGAGADSTPAGGAGADSTPAGGAGADSIPAGTDPNDWRVRRLDETTGKLRAEQREHQNTKDALALAQRSLAELRAAAAGGSPGAGADGGAGGKPGTPLDPATAAAEIERRVQDGIAAKDFERTCATIAEAGKAKYPDWAARMNEFNRLGNIPPEIIEAANATGKATDLLYELAGDLNEAYRIMQLPPIQAGIAIAKRADAIGGGRSASVSRLGAESGGPVGGGARGGARGSAADADPLSMDRPIGDWLRDRDKAVAIRQGRRTA